MWLCFQEHGFFRKHCALHWCGEHLDLCRLGLWIYFLPWSSYKSWTDQPRLEKLFQNLWKTLTSFWTLTIYGTWIRQLLSHSTTLMIGTLCTITTLEQQLTYLEQIYIRSSLHWERYTVKGRDCGSALHAIGKTTYRMDEWRKHLLQLKSRVISGNPEHWMEFHRLQWNVVVFKCCQFFLVVWVLMFFSAIFVVFRRNYFCYFSFIIFSDN